MSFRVVVLASGSGTLLQALLEACKSGTCPAEVVAVGSDNPDAKALVRAKNSGVETFCVPMERIFKLGSENRRLWDRNLVEKVKTYQPDLIILAGFMRLLDEPFMGEYGGKIINTHPSMLPDFPGAHAVRDALAAGVDQTGASIFWVDNGVDTGKLIAQVPVAILPGDSEEILHERIKVTERKLLVETVNMLAAEGNEKWL